MAAVQYTILLVEDDREVRNVAADLLDLRDYRVIEAGSGDEALELLEARPDMRIDLLFTDIVMPGRLDGIDLAHAARDLRPGLKVLFATGFGNLIRRNREAEIDGPILRKPYRPAELFELIAGLLADADPR